ncbi:MULTISPECIES: UDP-glucose/GDP-mannose dehydrogenase family protein [unclassified Solwaraspora]|uniref:UDP-glucose dehydrogenase family protein n=1 Tax=unclassified Solwaraspora TaxID=2627926 RepID=UPI00248D3334|nr:MULTISPECIES: UDP-glucose/GDP-mannose dehydrogenase family protein [unclassified Solwaraspora]WBB96194.1 UDP-glucose/GDP-mannose dehydrogenase family protein [Solwaraspora sp. WMMA2059]WBC19902.1 UDP-glucose/GDP-mannose dehydrogenase family protein [Solwaraspora sp. WMMA2080]WJK32505.1 UDP-glucose/GDP-mannose dehydrogenase family protein [Solwaraspora sp. WMMA2065]
MTIPYPNIQPVPAIAAVAPPSGAPRPRLTFLGTGYLGATYAICFAELGYEVIGYDVDADKIAKLSAGEVPFHEPGLDELLKRSLAAGRLRFTTDMAATAEFGDVHFICVGTPQRADAMGADLSYVEAAVTGLAQHLSRKALIVGKSTVPVGTAEWIEQLVGKHAQGDLGVEVAWSPEFLQEGFAVEDVLRPNRIVVGVRSEWANGMLYAAHKGVFDLAATEDREVPLVVTDFATAELVKVAANAFLATKISFINAMAEVCEVAGGDVTQLARAIGYDPRIGNRFLQAGVGFGGGCLPKDIRAFQARAQELGAGEALRFLHEVDLINQRRRSRVVQLAAELLDRRSGPAGPDLSGTTVAVLGATFKPNSDDVRDAPSLAVAAMLAKTGAQVRVFDPEGTENARRAQPDLAYVPSMVDAVRDADLVCVLTEWADFRNADPVSLGELVAGRRVIDGRNCLDSTLWTGAGWQYRGMGRP